MFSLDVFKIWRHLLQKKKNSCLDYKHSRFVFKLSNERFHYDKSFIGISILYIFSSVNINKERVAFKQIFGLPSPSPKSSNLCLDNKL